MLIYRVRWGNEDRIPKKKCDNLKGGETKRLEFGACLCKPEHNTFYDYNGFDCASMTLIESREGK